MVNTRGQSIEGSRRSSASAPSRRRSASNSQGQSISNVLSSVPGANDPGWNNEFPYPGSSFADGANLDFSHYAQARRRSSSRSRRLNSSNAYPAFLDDLNLDPLIGLQNTTGGDQDIFNFDGLEEFNLSNWYDDNGNHWQGGNEGTQYDNLFNNANQPIGDNDTLVQDYAQGETARRASQKFESNGLFAVPSSQPPIVQQAVNPQFIDPALGGAGVPEGWPYEENNQSYNQTYNQTYDQSLFIEEAPGPSQSRKRSRSNSGDHTQNNKRARTSSHNSKSSGFKSSISASESESEALLRESRAIKKRASAVARFQPEKPKTDSDRPWVRTNTTTKGLTSRTAKINCYTSEYEKRDHPLGTWRSDHHEFKYNADGEFADSVMSARQIKEFIFQYPKNNKLAKLKIWIQKGPSDSARRYNTSTWAKCRFRECPVQLYQTGTILHGHYRVAFDEKWHRDRENSDPHLVSGYVHLYCMERFLDFPSVCRHADVEVDTRQLTNEPGGKFSATLAGTPECGIAQDFVQKARRGRLHEIREFSNYPRHEDYKGRPKPHRDTLTYHMFNVKNNLRPSAQVAQLSKRKLQATQTIVHQGDLELLMTASRERKAKQRTGRKRKAESQESESDDFEETAVKQKVKQAKDWAQQKLIEQPVNQSKRKKVDSGRRADANAENEDPPEEHFSVHDSDSEDDYAGPRLRESPGSRRSDRIRSKQPVNYGELQSPRYAHPPGYAPAQAPRNPSFSDRLPAAIQDFISPDLQERLTTPEVQQYLPIELFNDPDVDPDVMRAILDQDLQRRKSSLISILKSPDAMRKGSNDRRISFGRNQTKVFDSELPAKHQFVGQRRSSRHPHPHGWKPYDR